MTTSGTRKGGGPQVLRTGVITSLALKGGRGERVAVYIDGSRAFDLDGMVAEKAGLRRDDLLTDERQRELLREDEPYRAREIALTMLARRAFLGSELVVRLSEKGISEANARATVAWLAERKYVDDLRYAQSYFQEKTKAGWGRQRVISELTKKGMRRNEAAEAWRRWSEEQDGNVLQGKLVELIKRKFAIQFETDPAVAKRRASGFLARRGHDWETIATVLRAVDKEG